MTTTSNGHARTVTDPFVDLVSRGQRAVTDAATGMAEMWGAALSGADDATRRASGPLPTTASLGEAVDRAVDTGIAVLEMQRSVAHQVLDALRLR
jgi:glycerate kinase